MKTDITYSQCKYQSNSNMFQVSNDYMFEVNNRNTRTRNEIGSKLTINIRQWRRSGIFVVNFEYISHLVLVFLLLTLSR